MRDRMAVTTAAVITATTWAVITAAVIISVAITVADVISDIAGTTGIISADVTEVTIGAIVEAIGTGDTIVITGIGAVIAAGGTAAGGHMASAHAGAGRPTTIGSYGSATKTLRRGGCLRMREHPANKRPRFARGRFLLRHARDVTNDTQNLTRPAAPLTHRRSNSD
jgi:hypothetical protein